MISNRYYTVLNSLFKFPLSPQENYNQVQKPAVLDPRHNYELKTDSKALGKSQQLSQMKNYINNLQYEKHEVAAVSALLGFLLLGVILMILNFCDCVYCRWNGCVFR